MEIQPPRSCEPIEPLRREDRRDFAAKVGSYLGREWRLGEEEELALRERIPNEPPPHFLPEFDQEEFPAAEYALQQMSLKEQLHRAALSTPLNIAQGAGEYAVEEKARFYRMAQKVCD